jgi:hypothetical protein
LLFRGNTVTGWVCTLLRFGHFVLLAAANIAL